ncbi:hypothetical protein JK386_16365 [Nocardioides sp. zg-536]|uniref:Uncharacterized protein n=1 Tax=Nocardioides faecalis TaxID=2803858 RepID=A0A938YCS1_9ACTN|nr:hypothetical protein [Nocardioides faecalis]MBM9461479.1 hypothetical protein [Nocardioides faecalis]MBS4751807.1 hypothetical protein [Nocardioides faecalis]QVI59334.1 hypothetical protein KG111_02895 [Nocardioides faecalis]
MSQPQPHDDHQSDNKQRAWFTTLRLPLLLLLVLAILLVIGIALNM